ncbi:PH domain-containing protein [Stenotrophomonas sp. SY1]|uniref:PH domain-containing protein n=1 Tax=Stenotrophomonas sp. SY1 TaxID=477235 RepID=UPI001E528733|nr:PH domain-containing protein [Stenotrophomonas sp. SY1]
MIDAPAPDEQRLHPWSWLFALQQQIQQLLVPLVALLFFGSRRQGDEFPYAHWLTLAVIVSLVASAVLQYLTYRYRIGSDALVIRSGILERTRREIPFARIHNVVVHQNLLHRLFGVAELRLESAAGDKPEAQMRVLKLEQALELERLIRQRGSQPAASDAPAEPAPDVLLTLSLPEIVRQGLISNRALVVIAAAIGAGYQMLPRNALEDFIDQQGRQMTGYASQLQLDTSTLIASGVFALLVMVVLMQLLSIGLAIVQYYGFRLSEAEKRLTVERGLLSRLRTSVARRRIQAWTLRESALHRLFGRRQLRVDIASGGNQEKDGRALKELAPVATPEACDGLLQHLLPQLQWPPQQWHAVSTRGWWRLCLPALIVTGLLAALLTYETGPWGLLPLLWLPWSAFKAHRQVTRIGYSIDARRVAVRGGWWNRWWRVAELDKLQALRLDRSPLDHRFGTATLTLDTAGAFGAPPLQLRFLEEQQARDLMQQLVKEMARRKLRW